MYYWFKFLYSTYFKAQNGLQTFGEKSFKLAGIRLDTIKERVKRWYYKKNYGFFNY